MNLAYRQYRRSNQGSTTVIVLMSILALSIAAAALLSGQRNLFKAIQKIEHQEIGRDISDLCLKMVVNNLKGLALNGQMPTDLVNDTIVPVDFFTFFKNTQSLSGAAKSTFALYTTGTYLSCRYKFVKQRPVTGTTSTGEVTQDRAYQNTGSENVYIVNAITCSASFVSSGTATVKPVCNASRTEQNIYIGIQ